MDNDSKKSAGRRGLSFAGVLTAIFVAMKVGGVGDVKDWSWWWVISPLWIELGLCLIILIPLWAALKVLERRERRRRQERIVKILAREALANKRPQRYQ